MRCCLIGLLLLAALPGDAKRIHASIVEAYREDFKFVTYFGFEKGTASTIRPARIILRSWTFMEDQRVLVFRDEKWFKAYNERTSCAERAALADYNYSVPTGGFYGKASTVMDVSPLVEGAPQFWYIALARCREWMHINDSHVPDGVFMYYEASLTNANLDQFSVDEQGLLTVHMIFTCLYSTLVAIFITIAFKRLQQILRAKRLQRAAAAPSAAARSSTSGLRALLQLDTDVTTLGFIAKVQLFLSLLGLFIAHHVFAILHLSWYQIDGTGASWAAHASEALGHAAAVLLTLALLWISKGYTITVTHLKPLERVVQLTVTFVLIVLYATAFVIDFATRDAADAPEAYAPHEAMAARLLIPLRSLLAIWFVRNVLRTMRAERELVKAAQPADSRARASARTFYRLILVAGVLWFLSVPLWHAVTLALPHYTRRRAFDIASACSNILILAVLVIRGTTSFGRFKMRSRGAVPPGAAAPSAADDMLQADDMLPVSVLIRRI